MKNKIRRLSKGSLSVVLAIMMVISTMLIGSFTVNAAVTQWYVVGYQSNNNNMSWNINSAANFSGPTGSCTVDTNGNTNPIYFKLVAIDSNRRILCTTKNSTSEILDYNTRSNALDWKAGYDSWTNFDTATNSDGNDAELVYTPDSTATSVTFTVTSDGTYNYVTVSDNRSGSTDPSESEYYINGRFRVKNNTGDPTQMDWNLNYENDAFKFQPVSGQDGLYFLNTNCTIKELSEEIQCSGYSAAQYFYIYNSTNSTLYNAKETNLENCLGSDNAITLETGGTDEDMRFSDTASTSTDPVTIWLDTNNGMKLYYTLAGTSHNIITADLTGTNITSLSYSVDGETNVNTARTGEQVTVTAAPEENYVLDTVTVTYDGGTVPSEVTGNTATFTMPDADVTVSATARQAQTFTVKTAVNNEDMGSAAIADVQGNTTTVKEGDSVTLTATANSGYEFENWTADASFAGDVDITSPSITVYPTSDVTFTANFAEEKGTETGTYFILSANIDNPSNWNSSNAFVVPVYQSSDGKYYVEIDCSEHGITTSNYFGGLKNNSNVSVDGFINWKSGDSLVDNSNGLLQLESNKEYSGYHYIRVAPTKGDLQTIRIEFNSINPSEEITYTFSATEPPVDPTVVNVYAKNGTVAANGNGTSKYGETTITNENVSDYDTNYTDYFNYKVYTAKEGNTIDIQTTVKSPYLEGGYYVAAFQVNGQTLEAESNGKGVYTAEYLIPDDFEDNLEITPVYYNRKIEEAGDYITMYVDPSQLPADDRGVQLWTNQIACYAYYYVGDGSTTAVVIDGAYPGQPMLKAANGKWYTKVSKYYYDENGVKNSRNLEVSGITLNNYTNDSVHGSLVPDAYKVNRQTYDFDDFTKIADLDYDIVEFRIEYRGGDYASNQELLVNNTYDNSVIPDKLDSFTAYDSKDWVALKDYKDNYVSLTYDILDKTEAENNFDSNNYLRVISVGNQNIAGHGEWSTVWYVFDKDGNYITKGVPSDFLPTPEGESATGNAEAVQNALKDYAGIPVRICYEKEMTGLEHAVSSDAYRIDGQWYFGSSTDPIDANVIAQIPGSSDNTWVTDSSGTNKATINGQTSVHYDDRDHTGLLVAQAGSGYMFAGWGYLDDNDEFVSFDNSTKLNTSVSVPLNQNYTFVARFVPVTNGTLVINHGKYTGKDAKLGDAYYYVSAIAHNTDGDVTYRRTENSLSIPVNSTTTNTIDITITVVPKGDNEYVGTYAFDYIFSDYYPIYNVDDLEGNDPDYNFSQNGKAYSLTFTTTVENIFKINDQVIKTYSFYSDVAPVTSTAVLNYKYVNRFGETNNYTVIAILNDAYIEENGKRITNELIYKNAPAIDDLHKDCTWIITSEKCSISGTTATLEATQDEKTYRGTIDIGDGEKKSFEGITYNEFLKTELNDYYRCPYEENFQYWSVREFGTEKEVARFYHPWFAMRIVDDYDIVAICDESADVQDNVYIGSPVYSREQITDSDGSNPQDYLYADFLVAYMCKENIKLSENSNYKTGLLIETNANAVLSDENIDNGSADYSSITFDSLDEKLEIIATSGRSGKFAYYTDENKENKNSVTNFIIDNNDYSNLNRMDYYVRFNNNETNAKAVMKAYYYAYQVDDEGNVIEDSFKITECVYFNLYDISQSTPNTSA